jgi:hypothetical protein
MNLIYSRRADGNHLTTAEINRLAPSVFTEGHKDGLSSLYGEVDSKNVIEIMRDYGFGVSQAAQKKPRKAEAIPYAEHLVAFSRPNPVGFHNDFNATRPEIIMYNSRNGLSSLRLFAGVFRLVCSNGMVAGEGMESRVRHTLKQVSDLEDAIVGSIKVLPTIMDRVERMRSIKMDKFDTLEFVKNAATLRWEWLDDDAKHHPAKENGTYATSETVQGIAWTLNRREDASNDLWTVFNRTQEKMVRGGVDVVSVTDKNRHGKYRTAAAVRSIGENVRINRQLWDMAEEVMA